MPVPPPPRIAVVDDDESVLKALSRLLRACGFEAECFASGRIFLASLPDRLPDGILLDIQMPDLDGYEVLAELAVLGCPVPVVLMTGDTDPASRERALSAGAVALLRKPFTDGEMVGALVMTLEEKVSTFTR